VSWSAVLPGAAVRMPRTAAGWRALRVALLVGGVLVVGLLCGERAYAADGVRALTDGTAGWVADGQRPMTRPDAHVPRGRAQPYVDVRESRQRLGVHVPVGRDWPDAYAPEPRQRGAAHVLAGRVDSRGSRSVFGVGGVPLAGVDVEAVGERVVRVAAKEPSSSGPLPSSKLPVLSELPVLSDPPTAPKPPKSPKSPKRPTLPDLSNPPALPRLPVLPDLPDLPDLSGLPGLTDLPNLPNFPGPSDLLRPPPPPPSPPTGEVTLPEAPGLPGSPSSPALPGHLPGHPLPAPVTVDPQPGRTAPSPADEPAPVGPTDGAEFVAADSDNEVRGCGHRAAGWTEHAGHTRPADHAAQSARVGHGPGGHAPTGRPDGTLGNRSAADNGTSRHGDPHAVTLSDRNPLRLLPGVAARSCAAGTRDSHGDIPVFPG
jgi:hypothetical protein